MMPPIRCFTCGAVVGDKFEEYSEKIAAGKRPGAVLDEMGIKRYCCRRMFLSNVNLIEESLKFYVPSKEEGKI